MKEYCIVVDFSNAIVICLILHTETAKITLTLLKTKLGIFLAYTIVVKNTQVRRLVHCGAFVSIFALKLIFTLKQCIERVGHSYEAHLGPCINCIG